MRTTAAATRLVNSPAGTARTLRQSHQDRRAGPIPRRRGETKTCVSYLRCSGSPSPSASLPIQYITRPPSGAARRWAGSASCGSPSPRPKSGLPRRLRHAEGAIDHAERDLALAHDDEARPVLGEVLDLGVGVGAGNDQKLGVGLAREFDHGAGLETIRNRHE